ncbi:RAM signaling pathway protein-domain-containing protein [Amylocystis lapponica]|nr:RAM signaling pathway protein-domain-containing protein [Amylocystis lapponica]
MSSSEAEVPSGRLSSHTIRNGVSSPLPSISLSRDHITEALSKSPDNGGTLDLAHKGLTDVGESGAEELATVGQEDGGDSTVVRIALAYNRLTTLPMAFALLSRLRYLVLKNNNFSVFPDVLTVMPSLEILDISRNKIKRFPSDPGSLANLRVFSVIRNKIHKLPAYFTQFRELTLFKVDQNPIEWPPRSVMECSGNLDDPQVMTAWIHDVQKWIENNCPLSAERKMSGDSLPQEEQSSQGLQSESSIDKSLEDPSHLTSSNSSLQANALYHSRSFSLESSTSAYFQLDRSHSRAEPGPSNGVRHDWSPPLDFKSLLPGTPDSTSTSPSHSPERYFDDDSSSADDDATIPNRSQLIHGRNASYAGRGYKTSRNGLSIKKSLPDLRPAKLHLTTSSNGVPAQRTGGVETNGFTSSHNPAASPQEHVAESPVTLDRPAPAMDMERHSYFRRLSALKPSFISKAIPGELLALVDAVRGILFAVSHIYQTLQHYTVYVIDERLSAVLPKVLNPASVYMTQMINALDRFDSMSRRTLPPPAVCRAVVESCRDSVAVFKKAVGVLALQLKVLATHDDVRYTRQMLLVLYGAMSEIASSWQAMACRIEAVKPLLREARPPPVKSHTVQPSRSATVPFASTPSSTTFSLSLPALDSPRIPRANVMQDSGDGVKGRISRRHAGSFSSKDVEIGKMLPSYTEPLPLTPGITNGVLQSPALRTPRRVIPVFGSTPPTMQNLDGGPSGTNGQTSQRWDTHSRQGSQSSLNASSSSSSSLAFRAVYPDTASSTSTLVDKEVIELMTSVLEAAPAIWEMMDEILSEAQGLKEGLKVSLDRAKGVTERLRDSMAAMQAGAPTKDSLRDDAHLFVKTVIQLSGTIKGHATVNPLSPNARNNMAKLTNATQELLILLHVSSFSPSPTPRPYSPMVGAVAQPSPLGLPEDGRLGANLSRSRSALRPTASKFISNMRDPPHSAAPNQTFAIPTPPRFGPTRRADTDDMPVAG